MSFKTSLSETPTAREVRQALKQAGQEYHQLLRKAPEERGENFKEELTERANFITSYDVVEKALARAEQDDASESRGPLAAFDRPVTHARSAGEQVILSDHYRRAVADHTFERGQVVIDVAGSLFQRALVSEGTITNGIGSGNLGVMLPQAAPTMLPPQQRRLFVRNMLAVTPTTFPSLPYIQELNPSVNEGGASAVAEGQPKPEVTLQAERKDAPVKKIAAWIPVTTEILEDAPALLGYIEQRLTYMVLLREEQQILNGTGVDAQILGIRQTAGTQTQAAVGTNDVPATIAMAIGKVENVDGEADGVAMNPIDFWSAIGTRHSTQFDNGFGGNAPATVSSLTFGLPVVRTRSMERTAALVGSWRLGATLLDRQQVVIRLGEQHADYFTSNKVVVLAEERVGLQVNRPDFFVKTTIQTPA